MSKFEPTLLITLTCRAKSSGYFILAEKNTF